MKKKIVIGCIAIVFMLVAITVVSALGTRTTEKKESPLFSFRTNRAIKNNLNLEEFKLANFIRSRIFYIPQIGGERILSIRNILVGKFTDRCTSEEFTNNCATCMHSQIQVCCDSNNIRNDNIRDDFEIKTENEGYTCGKTCDGSPDTCIPNACISSEKKWC